MCVLHTHDVTNELRPFSRRLQLLSARLSTRSSPLASPSYKCSASHLSRDHYPDMTTSASHWGTSVRQRVYICAWSFCTNCFPGAAHTNIAVACYAEFCFCVSEPSALPLALTVTAMTSNVMYNVMYFYVCSAWRPWVPILLRTSRAEVESTHHGYDKRWLRLYV